MSNPLTEIETGPLSHAGGSLTITPAPLLSHPSPIDDGPVEDPFKYGWRDVKQLGEDGIERWVQIPLTREDVLHPQEGDHQLHNEPHQVFCIYLYNVFKSQLRADPSAVVFQDTGVFWDDPKLKHNSPDVTVILGVKKRRKWTSFYVKREGVRPALAVEVTSPQAMDVDMVDKHRIYQQAKVPLYVIVETDPKEGTRAVRLIGYQLTSEGYVEMKGDERGWLWLEPVRLFIGIQDEQVECYDAGGTRLGSYEEVTAALTSEAEARKEAESRASALESRARASDALAAAENEARREAEARAEAAEAQLRDLQVMLQRLQAGN